MGILANKQLFQIENECLYNAHLSGAKEVIKYKKELNSINVFPVADGDTGTNLAITMSGIMKKAHCLSTIQETFYSMADSAILSALGNSGTIFSQYLSGFAHALPATENITLNEFANSVHAGVIAAKESIQHPVEGTIITVMHDWSAAIHQAKKHSDEVVTVLTEALHEAVKSLNRTPYQLAVLKEKGVVDSGAKGFIIFLHGFMRYLRTREDTEYLLTDDELVWDEAFEHVHSHDHEEITHRYCTEALIEGDMIDVTQLKQEMQAFGDSIVVAGTNKKAKLHIHTSTPDQCFQQLSKYGVIIEQKAEDMMMQNMVVKQRKYPIALITDTIADLPKNILDQHQIHHFPLNLHINESTYLDRITIQSSSVYELLKTGNQQISSSQPNRKSIESLYSFLSTYYESIIVITVSKEMSGTYNAFHKVAETFRQKDVPITIINSKLNSAAQGLVVLKAAESIEQGASHDEVIKVVNEAIKKSSILVSVDNLKGMIASGRISKTVGKIGQIVNLKPIVSIDQDGRGVLIGKAYSTKSNTKQILKMVKHINETEGIERYAIVHGNGQLRLADFEQSLTHIIGQPPSYVEEVSSIVASSTGENTIAVAFLKK